MPYLLLHKWLNCTLSHNTEKASFEDDGTDSAVAPPHADP